MRSGVFALLLLMLAGCFGSPELPLIADVELAEDAPESGLVAADGDAPETVLQELQSVENVPKIETDLAAEPEKPRRGLLGLFRRKPAPDVSSESTEQQESAEGADSEIPTETKEGDVEIAAIAPPKESGSRNGGLFGLFGQKADPSEQVEPGTILPYGKIGVACAVRGKALGKEVDRFPAKGKGYRLYDSDPSTTQPRTHYLTGFKDGCPRQFTASLALLASPVLHEQLLFAEKSSQQHSNAADKAFEKIRKQICRVGRGKPCPEKRINALEKSMVFVTTYERFGGNASWEEILVHKGVLAASSHQAR